MAAVAPAVVSIDLMVYGCAFSGIIRYIVGGGAEGRSIASCLIRP